MIYSDKGLIAEITDIESLYRHFGVSWLLSPSRLLISPPPKFLIDAAVTLNQSLKYHAGTVDVRPDLESRRVALEIARPDLGHIQFLALRNAVLFEPSPTRGDRPVNNGLPTWRFFVEVYFNNRDYRLRMDGAWESAIPRSAPVWQPWC